MLWRSRRWRYLLNRIDHLPAWSFYMEAVADDEDAARRALNAPEAPPRGPRVAGYDPVVQRLDMVIDRLGSVVTTLVAANSQKRPPQIPPQPRPVTAFDRVRARAREATHGFLKSKLLGG